MGFSSQRMLRTMGLLAILLVKIRVVLHVEVAVIPDLVASTMLNCRPVTSHIHTTNGAVVSDKSLLAPEESKTLA
jgi:hypothetical protein